MELLYLSFNIFPWNSAMHCTNHEWIVDYHLLIALKVILGGESSGIPFYEVFLK